MHFQAQTDYEIPSVCEPESYSDRWTTTVTQAHSHLTLEDEGGIKVGPYDCYVDPLPIAPVTTS